MTMIAFFFFFAGGYELIYDHLHHILGISGRFSGVPMHMGHHFGHLRAVLGNSGLNHLNHQRFLQSGVANWMASQSRVVPCCDLDIVGGDGTAIGIPISNLKGMTPVWQPAECVGLQVPDDQEFENGRMGRIPISFNSVGKAEAQPGCPAQTQRFPHDGHFSKVVRTVLGRLSRANSSLATSRVQ